MFRFKEAFLAKYKGKAIADIKEGGKILLKILPCFSLYSACRVWRKSSMEKHPIIQKNNGCQNCQWTETSPRQFDVRP